MITQKLDRDAPPQFGKTGNHSNVRNAMTCLITGIDSGEEKTNEKSIATLRRRLDKTLRDLHEGGILEDDGLDVAHLTAEVYLQHKWADVFIDKATKLAKGDFKRGGKDYSSFFSPDFRIGSDRSGADEEEFRSLKRTLRWYAIIEGANLARQALCFASFQLGLHFEAYRKFPTSLQDAFDDLELPGMLVRSLEFADSVFARLNADYPGLMAELPQYRPWTRSVDHGEPAIRAESDAEDDSATEVAALIAVEAATQAISRIEEARAAEWP